MRSGIDAYRRVQREASPDEASMGTLLRVLVDSLLVARRAMVDQDFAKLNKHLLAAQQVLLQLRSGSRQLAGELGHNLEDLYAWCEVTLGRANVSHELQALDSVVAVLGNLRDGFEGVHQEGKSDE